jgi:hypothetical protein
VKPLLILALLLSPVAAQSWLFPATHVVVSASVPFAIHDCLRAMRVSKGASYWTALGVTAAACAGKEWLIDGKADVGDLICDAVGLGFAAVVLWRTQR